MLTPACIVMATEEIWGLVQRQAASSISAGASTVADVTQQGASVVATKAGEAKDAVQEKLQSDEERLKKEEEARKSKKKGPFGLF